MTARNPRQRMLERATRVRRRLKKRNAGRVRLSVFRSSKNIYAQLIDDVKGETLASASTLDESVKAKASKGGDAEAAALVGSLIAERAKEKGVTSVVFDRGGYMFHGRVKALAQAAREGGLEF